MRRIPICEHCGEGKIQPGRYEDWVCRCCDQSATCRHVSWWQRLKRRFSGRKA